MRKLVLAVVALGLAACGRESTSETSEPLQAHANAAAVCPGPALDGTARCHARVQTDAQGNPYTTPAPVGWTPADLQSAYNLASGGIGQTVAIVAAYDDPTAEADLGVYRSQFGLPPCTTANGCFKKVNQSGVQRQYPRADPGWALETSLDLDMVSAACPSCKILLVEANTNSIADLGASENTAVKLGANAVSNSWGGSEYSGELNDEQTYFNHLGVAITASSGDSGYGVEFPAASRFVTAVGGTTLTRAANARGWDETAWAGSSGGCSIYVTKPTWQTDIGCARRTVVDVSAVADPGAAVYDSTTYQGQKGWWTLGGTSLSAALIAGVYGLAGNASGTIYGSYPYSHTSYLYDITTGSNGTCGSYLCQAGPGYDGPTGLGTPNGTGGF